MADDKGGSPAKVGRPFVKSLQSTKDDPPLPATHLCRLPSPDDPPARPPLSFALNNMIAGGPAGSYFL